MHSISSSQTFNVFFSRGRETLKVTFFSGALDPMIHQPIELKCSEGSSRKCPTLLEKAIDLKKVENYIMGFGVTTLGEIEKLREASKQNIRRCAADYWGFNSETYLKRTGTLDPNQHNGTPSCERLTGYRKARGI